IFLHIMFKIILKLFPIFYFILSFLHMTEARSFYDDKSSIYLPSKKLLFRGTKFYNSFPLLYNKYGFYDSDLTKKSQVIRRAQPFVSEYNPAPCRWKLCANYY
uniref:Uncharacterized protein n=2 Tax=Strongyloides stercoralis TaxID=6248 RepID=A0AAF5I497_STRER